VAGVSDAGLGGVTLPAGAGLATVGAPVDGNSLAEAGVVTGTAPATAGPVTGAATTVGGATAGATTGATTPPAAGLLEAATAGPGVTEPGATTGTATGIADGPGMITVDWVTETVESVQGTAGALGMGIVTTLGDGLASPFAAWAAAASAGVSWTVVLLKTRVVSFMEVAGSRFS
jgi:hypothetical protein